MNHNFKSIFSKTLGTYVAVAETTKAGGKKTKGLRLSVVAAAIITPLLAMQGGLAVAGSCVESPPGTWVCSGPAGADLQQNPTAPVAAPITVTTAPGFGINTAVGSGISIIGAATNTGINFTDVNGSIITGDTNGIYARNYGTGTTSISSTGQVTGTNSNGITAYSGPSTTGLTINAAAVTGGTYGIYTVNSGTGTTSITSTGQVTGTSRDGIHA
jgi:autotransporter family porin